eukprot:TRINITY_DN1453_c0_g2_i3.p1 TRINITY_DN1453_c0_g2~~TRINITY_DN1453_c0_g2_i3.p1  ORF type:complete len:215 (+),score=77.76 TRINITY_DN1453_c0_g2_i3:54-698(+)
MAIMARLPVLLVVVVSVMAADPEVKEEVVDTTGIETAAECEEKVEAMERRAIVLEKKFESCMAPLQEVEENLHNARKVLMRGEVDANNATSYKHTAMLHAKESLEWLRKAKEHREASARNCTDFLNVVEARAAAIHSAAQFQEETHAAALGAVMDRLGISLAEQKQRVTTEARKSLELSLIHISEPTRLLSISYAVFCLKKKKKNRSKIVVHLS